jgi:drug/metabolite transporter (DMT)-like permease
VVLAAGERGWLAGAIVAGGVLAPALLMWGLAAMPAAGAALLLNAEVVFTALIAWFVFKENVDRRVALGIALIVAGALLLAWPGELGFDRRGLLLPALAVLAACLAWGIDNNLTRKVALGDASFIAMSKGLVAGSVNLALALASGARLPAPDVLLGAGVLGFLSYGLSLVLFVIALRHLGTARTGAYFSTAPFAGALLALPLLGESLSLPLLAAGALMAAGVWLHVSERHAHEHTHEALEHSHAHDHDEHHQHAHAGPVPAGTRHSHPHRHAALTHTHRHFPDSHHRHGH